MNGQRTISRAALDHIADYPGARLILVGVDPSSTATGLAVVIEGDSGLITLIDHSVHRPPNGIDPWRRALESGRAAHLWLSSVIEANHARATSGQHDALPIAVLVEVPSSRGNRGTGGHGLATLGAAAGAALMGAYRAAVDRLNTLGGEIVTVAGRDERWTRGHGKTKRRRMAELLVAVPGAVYKPDDDPGGDAADAIGLCVFEATLGHGSKKD